MEIRLLRTSRSHGDDHRRHVPLLSQEALALDVRGVQDTALPSCHCTYRDGDLEIVVVLFLIRVKLFVVLEIVVFFDPLEPDRVLVDDLKKSLAFLAP